MSDPVARLNAALEGRYAIERKLGEGGMATVYLADDLKHQRQVAVKVLKPELAAVVGAERFLAEVTTTANLTHPHILPLFDSGEADTFLFYVMPYLEGENLADRIDREKQLPVDEAVALASKVAGALQHAHEHGVIHRDIKPANILLQDGEPLVSDFGIALALGVAGGTRLTETDLSVGTPFYMSPEQATGDQAVGASTDTYALGSVLYEMLVGEPPYLGNTAQAVLGKIIAGKPVSATEQRPSIPANVDAAVRKALEKLPADRFTSAQEFAKALADPGFRHGEPAEASAGGAAAGRWNRRVIGFAALAGMFAGTAAWALFGPEPPELPEPVARFSAPFEDGQGPLSPSFMDFTADGSALVYTGPDSSGEGTQLWLRRWADLDATPIRGTEGALTPVLSPDGRELAFATQNALRVAPLDGGPSRTLVEGSAGVWEWTSDGFVYFSQPVEPGPSLVLARIPVTGGGNEAIEILTKLQEGGGAHILFSVLEGGKMGVFQVVRGFDVDATEVWSIDLETRERRFLMAGGTPRYASTGHLLFVTPDGVLMAQSIDPATAELTGPALSVAENLVTNLGLANYAVSKSGTLIYQDGGATASGLYQPVRITRSGEAVPVDPRNTLQAMELTGTTSGLTTSGS
jgi:serine/threonine-protein kinase